jgi:hypothetical protein
VATWDAERASFTPSQHDRSLRIGVDGGLEQGSRWPGAITAEVPWGDGGALAWNAVEATTYVREHARSKAVAESLPFKPVHAAWAGGTVAAWCARDRQLWHWTPGTLARRGSVMPAAGFTRIEGAEFVVAPVERDGLGRAIRRRLGVEWRGTHTGHDWRPVVVGAQGQCAQVARRGSWTARTHPFADLVRLDADHGGAYWLACYAPLGIAWAGSTLVVVNCDGALLVFRGVIEAVEGLQHGPPIAS